MISQGFKTFQTLELNALEAWIQAIGELDSPVPSHTPDEGNTTRHEMEEGGVEDNTEGRDAVTMDSYTIEDAIVLSDVYPDDSDFLTDSVLHRLSPAVYNSFLMGGRLLIPAPLRVLCTILSIGVLLGAGCYFIYLLYCAFSAFADRMSLRGIGISHIPPWGIIRGSTTRSAMGSLLLGRLSPLSAPTDRIISSDFMATEHFRSGASHSGIDFPLKLGTPVLWPFSSAGRVVNAWYDEIHGGGLSILVEDAEGGLWGFAHLSNNSIRAIGDRVEFGDILALSGDTGRSTGPHLHLSYRAGKGLSFSDPLSKFMQVEYPSFNSAQGIALGAGGAAVGYRAGHLSAAGNPMNVQYAGFSWEGSAGFEKASMGRRFVKFTSPLYGVRAGAKLLRNYQVHKDISSTGGLGVRLSDIGKLYVGGSMDGSVAYAGDDIGAWVSNVSRMTGYGKDDLIDLRNPQVLSNVVRAVARQESGSELSQEFADTAVSLLSGTVDDGYNVQFTGGADNVQRR